MVRQRLASHFIPHRHEDGKDHRAHALSLTSLLVYLQIFAVLAAGLYFIRLRAPHILGVVSFGADQIISLTNDKRAQNGLPALSANSALSTAAAAKAADMLASDYWAHNSPTGRTPWSFITAAGYRYIYAGENLARDFSDAASVVSAWMNSPSHRSNLMDGNFTEIGVAVAGGKLGGKEGTLVVQMFGARISQAPATQPVAVASPSPGPTTAKLASPSPAASAEPSASPLAILEVPEAGATGQQAVVLSSRQFSIAKGAALALVGFIFMLFMVETVVATRREDMKIRAGVIAHLGLLGFILLAVWYAVGGAII